MEAVAPMSGLVFLSVLTLTFVYYFRRVGLNLSLTSVALGLIIVIHGPFYWLYSRYWLYKNTWLYDWYSKAALTPTSTDPATPSAYDHLDRLANDPYISTAVHNLDIALTLLFIGVVAGTVAIDFFTRSSPSQFRQSLGQWRNDRLLHGETSLSFISMQAVLILFLCLALVAVYIHYDKPAVVYQYFFSSASEIEKIQWRRSSGGFPYLVAIFLSGVASFLSIFFLFQYKGRSSPMLILSVGFIVLIIFGKLSYLSKAPIIVYIMQIVLSFIVCRTLKLTLENTALLIIVGLLGMAGMVFIANSDLSNFEGAAAFLFYRCFMIPNESLLEYFLVFPNLLPHTLGMDNKFIAALSGSDKLLASYSRVAEAIRGVGGSNTNGLFIADAWAQFKWYGLIAFPLVLGALLRYLDVILIQRLGKRPISIAAMVAGYYGVFIAMTTSLFTSFLTGGLLLILPMVWVWSKLSASRASLEVDYQQKQRVTGE